MSHVIYPFAVCALHGNKGMFTYRNFYGESVWFPVFSWFIDLGKEKILIDCPGSADEMEKYSTAGLKGKDISPVEVIAHIPMLCKEKNIPYVVVPKKEELGAAVGLEVPTAAACVIQPGDAAKSIQEIEKQVKELRG